MWRFNEIFDREFEAVLYNYILDNLYFHIILLKHNWNISLENPSLYDGRPHILLDSVTDWVIRVLVDYKQKYIKLHSIFINFMYIKNMKF